MIRYATFLSALLLAAPDAAAEALKGIKGADDRVTVEASQYPWSAVGRVNNDGGHCSGVLIGPKLAVTAAHCLRNRRTGKAKLPQALFFAAGWDRGKYLSMSPVANYRIAPAWRFDAPYAPGPASVDWAILELAEPLGDKVGWVALGSPPSKGAQVVTVGYGQDRKHVPTAHLGCHFGSRLPQGAWTHDCDAVHGDSGAPIMVWTNGQPRLTAIHVATFGRKGKDSLGGAVGVDSFAAEAAKMGAATESRTGPLAQELDAVIKARVSR